MSRQSGDIHAERLLSFQRGEEAGFNWFFRMLYPRMCFFANRLINDMAEAEDIADVAFLKLWERHGNFESARSIKSFLYTTVRNACFDVLRREKRKLAHYRAMDVSLTNDEDIVLHEMVRSEVMSELQLSLQKLPPQCRKVFQLIFIEGKTTEEAAAELKLSVSTIRNQKARGLSILKKYLTALFTLAFQVFSVIG